MNLRNAGDLARNLMTEHKLYDWTFKFNSAKLKFGLCYYGIKTIKLSKHLTLLNDEYLVKDTILHEIAHALAGKKAGHGPKWKEIAKKIGANPTRCYDPEKVKQPKPKYSATCFRCNAIHKRYRKPSYNRIYFCAKCYNTDGVTAPLIFKDNSKKGEKNEQAISR